MWIYIGVHKLPSNLSCQNRLRGRGEQLPPACAGGSDRAWQSVDEKPVAIHTRSLWPATLPPGSQQSKMDATEFDKRGVPICNLSFTGVCSHDQEDNCHCLHLRMCICCLGHPWRHHLRAHVRFSSPFG